MTFCIHLNVITYCYASLSQKDMCLPQMSRNKGRVYTTVVPVHISVVKLEAV